MVCWMARTSDREPASADKSLKCQTPGDGRITTAELLYRPEEGVSKKLNTGRRQGPNHQTGHEDVVRVWADAATWKSAKQNIVLDRKLGSASRD